MTTLAFWMFFVTWAPSHLAAGPHFPQYFPSSWYALCYSKAWPSMPGHSTYSSYLWTLLMEINRTRQKPGLGSVLPSAPRDFKQRVQKLHRSCAEADFESPAANLKWYELQLNETIFSPLWQILYLSLYLPCCLPSTQLALMGCILSQSVIPSGRVSFCCSIFGKIHSTDF